MKIFATIALFLFFTNVSSAMNNVCIYGMVNPEAFIIKLYVPDNFTYSNKILAQDTISEYGKYKLSIYLQKPVIAILGDEKVLIHPGDSIQIDFLYNSIDRNYYQVKAVNHNNDFYYTFFYSALDNTKRRSSFGVFNMTKYYNPKDSSLNYEKYLTACKERKDDLLFELNEIFKKNHLLQSDYFLLQNEIYAEYAGLLLQKINDEKLNRTTTPDIYLDEIRKLIFSRSLTKAIDYPWIAQIYLEEILTDPTISNSALKIQTQFAICAKFFKWDLNIRNGLLYHLFDKIINDKEYQNDFVESQFKLWLPQKMGNKYETEIKNLYAFFKLKSKNKFSKNVLQSTLVDSYDRTLNFDTVIKNSPANSFIYFDFWATWCHPCLQDADYYENNRNIFDSLKITRVLIAVDEDKEKWKLNWNKGSKAQKDTYVSQNPSEIRKMLKIKTIPFYILMTNEGKLISLQAPSPTEYDKIKKIINDFKLTAQPN